MKQEIKGPRVKELKLCSTCRHRHEKNYDYCINCLQSEVDRSGWDTIEKTETEKNIETNESYINHTI